MATKVLDTEIFPQHTITEMISGITYVVQSAEAFTLKGNKHTDTDTDTDTDTHTHTHLLESLLGLALRKNLTNTSSYPNGAK